MTMPTVFSGIAAPLVRINIDTDTIIPSREMKHVSKTGLAEGLFANWRYLRPGTRDQNPDFILNKAPFDHATILVAGHNFGCGSSREHAVWALKEWGIRAIVAPSFGTIFATNCVNNGVLPLTLDEDAVGKLETIILKNPAVNQPTIDLENRRIMLADSVWEFNIGERDRRMLISGDSPITVTLQSSDLISKFEEDDRRNRPWAGL